VNKTKKKMGIDVIIRDSKGEVLTTLVEPKDHVIALDVVEAMSSLRVVNFSYELGFYRISLEGDVLQIVQALGKCVSNWSAYGHLIEEIWVVLNNLQNWKVHHVRRNLNGAAHRFANEALSLSEFQCFLEAIPHCIADIIVVERCT
jgi:hypothetical protein